MPHLMGAAGANSNYSYDMLALNQNSPYPQVNSASSSRRNSLQSNAWKRQSLPVVDPYMDLAPRHESEQHAPSPMMMQRRMPGDRTSLSNGNHHHNNNNNTGSASMNGTNGFNNGGPKQRKSYYDEQPFDHYREAVNGYTREKVQRESPIVAELRTNVIVKDEYTLVTDLSYHLAKRYSRPDSAIMVKVDHSACLALGATFDPCYILTLTAVPAHLGPTMNRRNAALIQSFMADILSVPPERGLIKFLPMPEENFATNGTTLLGEMERQEKLGGLGPGGARPDMARAMTAPNRKSIASMPMKRPNGPPPPPPAPSSSGNGMLAALSAPPKLDLDFPLPSASSATEPPSAVDTLAALGTMDEQKRTDQKKSTAPATTDQHPPTSLTSMHGPQGVFELPTGENEPKRPSTSHSHTAKTMTGLRVNSGDASSDAGCGGRLPNGRPRTFHGDDFRALSSNLSSSRAGDAPPQLPQLNIVSIPPQRKDRTAAFLRRENTSSPALAKATPQPLQHDGNGGKHDGKRDSKRDSYLDSLLGEPVQLTTIADLKQNTEPFIPLMLEGSKPVTGSGNLLQKRDSATSTAKRRTSTSVTATPKFPLAPPAIPGEDDDEEDAKRPKSAQRAQSQKVGKRKSFLAAFRRSTTVKH